MKTTLTLGGLAVAALLAGGCATEHYVKYVDPEDLPGLLKASGFDRHDTINIYCPEVMPNLRLQRRVMGILLREGFTRPILVGERKAYSELGRTAEERRRARVKSASGL